MSAYGTEKINDGFKLMSDTDAAIKLLGEDKVSCIRNLFDSLEGMPPQTQRKRYRADNKSVLEVLDHLEHSSQLIKCDDNQENYRLSPYAIPIVRNKKSKKLIKIMCDVYFVLKELYMERLSDTVTIKEIYTKMELPMPELKEALYYMFQAHDVWSGKSNGFPYSDDSSFCISESVLKRDNFLEVLTDYYRWHLINPQRNLSQNKLDCLFEGGSSSENRFFSENNSEYPTWFRDLGETEKSIIVEIDEAMRLGLKALPLMGARSLLENIMLSYIEDKGTFQKNLNEFCERGHVAKKQSDVLYQVIDAGSAVMHRAHIPSDKDVTTCMDVIKNLIQSLKVLNPKVNEIHKRLPKRK